MEPLSLTEVAAACAGELGGASGEVRVQRVTSDSRAVQAGDLFVALPGDRFDGHAYVAEAWRRGAVAALVDRSHPRAGDGRGPVVRVDNTRVALGRLAAFHRRRFQLPVVAVGGSNGKTTSKDLLAAVLGTRWATLASEASFNNDLGVPLTLLRLEARHEVAVLEAGTNHPGELAPLLGLIRPRYGVLTSLGREHLEFFGDAAGVRTEEGWMGEALPPEGRLFVNADSPGVEEVIRRTRAGVVRVGWQAGVEWRAAGGSTTADGTRFELVAAPAGWPGDYEIQLLGRHQVTNALLALAVAAELGLSPTEARAGLVGGAPPKMRLQRREVAGVTFLDDAYNANADSVLAALATLGEIPWTGRRAAVLGDMAELGAHTAPAHAEIGRAAALAGLAALFTVGAAAAETARSARAHGLVNVFENRDAAAAATALQDWLRPGDLVLLKASRTARLERVLADLATLGGPAAKRSLACCPC